MRPEIRKEDVKKILDARFVRVYDLQYAEGKHYYDASRRPQDAIFATKQEAEFRRALPDAVSGMVVVRTPGEEPRLLLEKEFRYPTGQFILGVPAGLIDPEDAETEIPEESLKNRHRKALFTAMKRELHEETGIVVKDTDYMEVLNPLVFMTPGLTDESNAMILTVVDLPDLSCLSEDGAVGSEVFNGFALLTKKDAEELLEKGADADGNFYALMTFAVMLYFVSGMWERNCPRK